jgi:NAD+ synthase
MPRQRPPDPVSVPLTSAEVGSEQLRIAAELGVAPKFDAGAEASRRIDFIADFVRTAKARTLVLGISGGVDSTVTGRMCQLAVETLRRTGLDARFIAMRLPYGVQNDEVDAQLALAFIAADQTLTVDVQPASDAAMRALEAAGVRFLDLSHRDFALGNIKARQRMIAQYAVAGTTGGLVVGTDHAAEALMGFFTKYGDGGCDLAPLSGLTKRRVRDIAAELGAPSRLASKTPTADLETLQPLRPDEAAMGVRYEDIDDFLEGRTVSPSALQVIFDAYRRTAHKRALPAIPGRSPEAASTPGS